jgi:aldehyde dehydrogenase (NAD+)
MPYSAGGYENVVRWRGAERMGAYHGEWGFQAMSHRKAVLANTTTPELKLLYPPYTAERAVKILRKLF